MYTEIFPRFPILVFNGNLGTRLRSQFKVSFAVQKLISLMRPICLFSLLFLLPWENGYRWCGTYIQRNITQAQKKNEIRPFAATWIDAETIIPSEVSQRKTNIWYHLYMQPHGIYSPWVGNHSLLQGIFPTQGWNPGLPHCRRILYQLSHKGSPRILGWVAYPFSSGSSRLRNWTGVSCIAGGFFDNWAISEAPETCNLRNTTNKLIYKI